MTEKQLIDAENKCDDGLKTSVCGIMGGWGLSANSTSKFQLTVGLIMLFVMGLRFWYYQNRSKELIYKAERNIL